MSRVHILGGGLAGLSAAVLLVQAGRPVTLYEAAPQAGGRCRSLWDPVLGAVIDTGSHLMLSGNHALRAHVARCGAAARLREAPAAYPFHDLQDGRAWTLRPNRGPLPWWMLLPSRRTPGLGALAHLGLLRLLAARRGTVAEAAGTSPLWRRLIEPLALAVLNTHPAEAAAAPLAAVLGETFARGADAMRPLLAPDGLSAALIDPALAVLADAGAEIRLGCPLRGVEVEGGAVRTLLLRGERRELMPGDVVLSALPPQAAARCLGPWLPDVAGPWQVSPILNVHFRLPGPTAGGDGFCGLIGGAGQWLFRRGTVASVTVSAAEAESAPERLWAEVAPLLGLPGTPLPPHRVVVAHAATLRHTPDQESRRPAARTRLENLILAGDWTATGLPCTLEGACRSAEHAARLVQCLTR